MSQLLTLQCLLAAEAENLFAPDLLLALDEREEFPTEQYEALQTWGLAAHYVPAQWGGALESYPVTLRILHQLAAHDLTLAIAHAKTFLGGVCVWVGGDAFQAQKVAEAVLAGAAVSWGLTERDHGSDLLGGEVSARRDADDWRLNGEKWLINNATRGHMICVLARTAEAGGARGFSLFLIDKRSLAPDVFVYLPKTRLHGIRGADISGIRFNDSPVQDAALVGGKGKGLEVVLKSLQLTRTLCVGLSTGALDHALRLTVAYVARRRLHGREMVQQPAVRLALGQAASAAFVAEAVAVMSGRALHGLTSEMSVVSAICKALVPTLADRVLSDLGELMELGSVRISANVTADFGNVTDSAGLGVARC